MSLSNPLPRDTRQSPAYLANGVATAFPVPFWFLDPLDLIVLITDLAGAVTTLSGGVGYSATGAGVAGGGTVTLASAPAAGFTVRIVGKRVPSRVTNATNGGAVTTAALEGDLDAQVATAQELRRDIDGLAAGLLVAAGVTLEQAAAAIAGSPASYRVYGSVAALRAVAVTGGMLVSTSGYYAPGDGGHNAFVGVTGAAVGTYADNGGTVILPTGGDGSKAWVAQPGRINILQFGAQKCALNVMPYGAAFSATADGSSATVTASISSGLAVGMNVCSVNWHSIGAAAIPTPTTITAVSGANVTLSRVLPAGTYKLVGYRYSTDATIAGIDSAPKIQAAVDYALRNGISEVYVPEGVYKTKDTIQLGYGERFSTVNLVGPWRTGFDPGIGGGAFIFTFMTDRPAINIQGGRVSGCRGLALIGPNYSYAFWGQAYNVALSADPLDWIAPELAATGTTPGGLQQHTPLAGVTIDAFSGSAPAAPYPRSWPAWTGLSAAYGAAFTSDPAVSECHIYGYAVQIGIGLNTLTQGDFVKIPGAQLGGGAFGLCIGNSQSRTPEIRNVSVLGLHSMIDLNMGAAQGKLGGDIQNCNVSSAYQLIRATGAAAAYGPINIRNCYMEATVRIGDVSGSAAFTFSVNLEDCELTLDDNYMGQIPAALLIAGDGPVSFRRNMLNLSSRITTLCCGGTTLELEGNTFSCIRQGASSAAMISAVNFTGGCNPGGPRFNSNGRNGLRASGNEMTWLLATGTGGISSRKAGDELSFPALRMPAHAMMRYFYDTRGRRWNFVTPADAGLTRLVYFSSASQIVGAPSWANDVMSCVMKGAFYLANPPNVGAVLYHMASGVNFVLTAVGAVDGSGNYPLTFQQQNGITLQKFNDPSPGAFVSNQLTDTALSGYCVLMRTDVVCPQEVYYGTFTSGSPSVTGVSRGDSYGGSMAAYLAAGDVMLGPAWNVASNVVYNTPNPSGVTTLAAVTPGSPGSITLGGAANAGGSYPIYPLEIV